MNHNEHEPISAPPRPRDLRHRRSRTTVGLRNRTRGCHPTTRQLSRRVLLERSRGLGHGLTRHGSHRHANIRRRPFLGPTCPPFPAVHHTVHAVRGRPARLDQHRRPGRVRGQKTPSCHTILLRTEDGGRHWSHLAAPDINGDAITFVDPFHGRLIHSQNPCKSFCLQRLYATADGGVTWRLIRAAPRFAFTTMSWLSPQRGWIGGGNPRSCVSSIFATDDGGKSWTRQLALPRHCGVMEVKMLDARRGWAIGGMDSGHCSMGGCDDYTLYRTVDGGKHWTTELASPRRWWDVGQAYGGFPGPPLFVTARYGWVPFDTGAGPGTGGIAITTDGGHTWRRVLGAYSLITSSVDLINTHDGWIAGLSRLCPSASCSADLLHTIDGGRTWSQTAPAAVMGHGGKQRGSGPD